MKQNNFTRIALLVMTAVGLCVPAFATDRTDPIIVPLVSDTSSDVISKILGSTLENAGYRVNYVEADYTASFSGIQTGDLHYTICWQSTWDLCEDSTKTGKAENVGSTGISSAEGWWYPISLKEQCPGLPDWTALKEPACIEALATAETAPLARFVEGPADWVMPVAEMAKAFDIKVQPIASGSAAAMVATISAAAKRSEPVIGWGYTPHWYFMSDEGEFVQFPEFAPECHSDPAWGMNPEATHDCSVQTGSLWVFANSDLLAEEAKAKAIMEDFALTDAQLANVFRSIDVDGVELDEAVATWMADNEAVWSAWVN